MKPNIPVFHIVNAWVGAAPCFWGSCENSSGVAGDANSDNSLRSLVPQPLGLPLFDQDNRCRDVLGTFLRPFVYKWPLENSYTRLISGRENTPSGTGCQIFSSDEPGLSVAMWAIPIRWFAIHPTICFQNGKRDSHKESHKSNHVQFEREQLPSVTWTDMPDTTYSPHENISQMPRTFKQVLPNSGQEKNILVVGCHELYYDERQKFNFI